MENSLSQNISQQQKQLLSQQQQQALKLLELPLMALEERIDQELEKNPLLEEELPPAGEQISDHEEKDQDSSGDIPTDRELAQTFWGDDLPAGSVYANSDDDGDFWSNTAAPPPSMDEQLEAEIATSGLSEKQVFLANNIISNLNANGYLASHLADLAMVCDADMDEMEEALAIVQSFDPPGIAARTVGECLKLQLQRKGALTPFLEKLTTDDTLEEIAKNRIPQLAKKLNVTVDEIVRSIAELKKLNPFPGGAFSAEKEDSFRPEIEIVSKGSGYIVNTLSTRLQRLSVPQRYEELLNDPETAPEAKVWLEEKMRSANELLEAIRLRGDTLTGIGTVLIRTQGAFLDYGPEELRPLTMKQAGEMLGLNESTISRAVAGKSVKTPRGEFPLKYFFSSGFKSDDGEDIAARAVQEKIRAIISSEDPRDPLSDDKISQLLAADGLNVARRTIAKYRDILKIPSTRLRKRFE